MQRSIRKCGLFSMMAWTSPYISCIIIIVCYIAERKEGREREIDFKTRLSSERQQSVNTARPIIKHYFLEFNKSHSWNDVPLWM